MIELPDIIDIISSDNFKWLITGFASLFGFLILNGRWRKEQFLKTWRMRRETFLSRLMAMQDQIEKSIFNRDFNDFNLNKFYLFGDTFVVEILDNQSQLQFFFTSSLCQSELATMQNLSKSERDACSEEEIQLLSLLSGVIMSIRYIVQRLMVAEVLYSSLLPFWLTRLLVPFTQRKLVARYIRRHMMATNPSSFNNSVAPHRALNK